MKLEKAVTINDKERLFIIPCAGGFSCLGFDVCRERVGKLERELGHTHTAIHSKRYDNALDLYEHYEVLVSEARERNQKTGWRSSSELTPQLIGLEGKRVEIVHQWESSGRVEKVRFIVGKSMGFIPCHLEIKTRRSHGGGAVCLGKIQSLRVVG